MSVEVTPEFRETAHAVARCTAASAHSPTEYHSANCTAIARALAEVAEKARREENEACEKLCKDRKDYWDTKPIGEHMHRAFEAEQCEQKIAARRVRP